MKCLIIAAGQGTRLRGVGDSKPLILLHGKPLIHRVIETAGNAGVDEFYVVTGYNAAKVVETLQNFAQNSGTHITFIDNDEWEKQNGISVLKARSVIDGPFFLLMSDHLFDYSILSRLTENAAARESQNVILAVDTRLENNPLVDLEDVTKVKQQKGNIIDIGKHLTDYNAFDTGIFYCTPGIFDALEQSINQGDSSLSGGIRVLAAAGKAGVMDIGNAVWIDVDNEDMLEKAATLYNENE
jgi:choline kinase